MASPLVALHVTPDAESLAAASLRALEGLLTSVRVAMDAEAAGTAEGLVTGLADVAVLALGVEAGRGLQIMVMLP